MSLNIHVIPWHSNSFTVIMMNDMALMISWMPSWWHPNSWWHFDYHRTSPLNRGVMSWRLTNCNDSITAWYHKIPGCFGQTWQSPWWYQEKWWHSHDRPSHSTLNHDTTKSKCMWSSFMGSFLWNHRAVHILIFSTLYFFSQGNRISTNKRCRAHGTTSLR